MVFQSRKYTNPPVVEALCEIFFTDSKWDSTLPGLFYEKIKDRYPRKKELQQVGVEVSVSSDSLTSRGHRGEPRLQCFRPDGSQLIQIEKDLLVVNQLKPYPRYEDWKPVVEEMLGLYLDLSNARTIRQIGVRYINRIVMPTPSFRMEEYFQIYPEIPDTISSIHGRFMMRMEIPPRHSGHNLTVTFGTSRASSPGMAALLLDLYNQYPSREGIARQEVERILEESHEHIITAFENSITDASRTLFE